jgi:hypothetical protein
VLLVAVRIDRLAEVAVLVEQADANERQCHVAGRLDMIAGEHSQTTGVDAERFVKAIFGAEVGDGAIQRGAVLAVEPMLCAARHVAIELGQDLTVLGHEGGVVEQLRPGDRLRQDLDRVPVARPRDTVNTTEEGARPRVPAPPHVVGQTAQAFELRWKSKRGPGQGGNSKERVHLPA